MRHDPPDPRFADRDAAAGGNHHLDAIELPRRHAATLRSDPVARSPRTAALGVLRRPEHRPWTGVAIGAGGRRTVVYDVGSRLRVARHQQGEQGREDRDDRPRFDLDGYTWHWRAVIRGQGGGGKHQALTCTLTALLAPGG